VERRETPGHGESPERGVGGRSASILVGGSRRAGRAGSRAAARTPGREGAPVSLRAWHHWRVDDTIRNRQTDEQGPAGFGSLSLSTLPAMSPITAALLLIIEITSA
jgi:hypothetical protein